MMNCPDCKGHGRDPAFTVHPCMTCGGTGTVTVTPPRVLDAYQDIHVPSGKKRGRKKFKERTIDRFFQCRMKVPTVPDEPERERYLDDWAPNLRGPEGKLDEVHVSVIGWRRFYGTDDQPSFRVSVWGGDDMGMERDYLYSETTPLELVQFVLSFPSPLTKSWLLEHGFQYS